MISGREMIASHILSHLLDRIDVIEKRYADGLHGDIHPVESTSSNVPEPANCDHIFLDLVLRECANKVTFRDLT